MLRVCFRRPETTELGVLPSALSKETARPTAGDGLLPAVCASQSLLLLFSPLPSPISIHPSLAVLFFALGEPTDGLPWTTENTFDAEELSRQTTGPAGVGEAVFVRGCAVQTWVSWHWARGCWLAGASAAVGTLRRQLRSPSTAFLFAHGRRRCLAGLCVLAATGCFPATSATLSSRFIN